MDLDLSGCAPGNGGATTNDHSDHDNCDWTHISPPKPDRAHALTCLIANDGAYARLASPISRERVLVGPAKESGVSASATANDLWLIFGLVRYGFF